MQTVNIHELLGHGCRFGKLHRPEISTPVNTKGNTEKLLFGLCDKEYPPQPHKLVFPDD